MHTLMNMNPWSMLADLLDTDSRTYRNVQAHAAGRFPPVNVYLDDHAVLVDVELPGRTAKDVSLALEPQAVPIAGPVCWNSPSAWTSARRTRSSRTASSASNCRSRMPPPSARS